MPERDVELRTAGVEESADRDAEEASIMDADRDQQSAMEAIARRLHQRGIDLDEEELDDHAVELLGLVEEFERLVQAGGGDLMVDEPPSREPDDPTFALPRRSADESITAYVRRVRQAIDKLREQ